MNHHSVKKHKGVNIGLILTGSKVEIDFKGYTCLHFFFCEHGMRKYVLRKALRILLFNGEDKFAVDRFTGLVGRVLVSNSVRSLLLSTR